MKKLFILAIATLSYANAFAASVTCVSNDIGHINQRVTKVVTEETLAQGLANGIVYRKNNVEYLLAISDMAVPGEGYKKLSVFAGGGIGRKSVQDAMALSTIKNGEATKNIMSDGNFIVLIDRENGVEITCKRD
jgi:hypothetical protein